MTAHRPMHPGGRLVLAYFVLAFAWTWGWWGYAAASRREWTEWPALVAFLLGGLGPLLAAFTVIRLGRGRTEQRQFWSRVFLPRRVPGRWWLAILAVAMGGRSLALLIANAFWTRCG